MGMGRSRAPTLSCHPYPTEASPPAGTDSQIPIGQICEQAAPSGVKHFYITTSTA